MRFAQQCRGAALKCEECIFINNRTAMDEEVETNLTKEEEQTSKENLLETPDTGDDTEPADPTTTDKPLNVLLRPPIEQDTSLTTNRYSATTLPLPNRPASTLSESNENIYDQLPATLPKRPKQTTDISQNVPPSVKEEETTEEKVIKKEREIHEIEASKKKYDNINTHKICTIVTMALCGLILNIFAFSCLIPAFIYSTKARKYLDEDEDLTNAEKYAKRSLILNLIAVIVTLAVLFAIFIILQIVFVSTGLY